MRRTKRSESEEAKCGYQHPPSLLPDLSVWARESAMCVCVRACVRTAHRGQCMLAFLLQLRVPRKALKAWVGACVFNHTSNTDRDTRTETHSDIFHRRSWDQLELSLGVSAKFWRFFPEMQILRCANCSWTQSAPARAALFSLSLSLLRSKMLSWRKKAKIKANRICSKFPNVYVFSISVGISNSEEKLSWQLEP